jgi:hypothetical protein
VDVRGEILELKNTINTMVNQLSSFASEVTRVAREVGTEGKLGGQAVVKGLYSQWLKRSATAKLSDKERDMLVCVEENGRRLQALLGALREYIYQ